MMHPRQWSPRRIGFLWLAGCSVEALLVAVFLWTGEPAAEYPGPPLAADASAAPTTAAEFDSAMRDVGFTVTRDTLPSGHTLTRIGRDSS